MKQYQVRHKQRGIREKYIINISRSREENHLKIKILVKKYIAVCSKHTGNKYILYVRGFMRKESAIDEMKQEKPLYVKSLLKTTLPSHQIPPLT